MRPHVFSLLPLLALAACATPFPGRDFPDDPSNDFDGDGVTESAGDCDDLHPTIRPGAAEICDQVDNDCDGLADNDPTDPTSWYRDSDGDLYGDDTVVTSACTAPTGFVARNGDCDDGKSLVHPGVNETCTDFDDNCDGDVQVPEGTEAPTWYLDRDGDNFGDVRVPSVPSCEAPAGYVYDASDCDDLRADVRPRANEVCDGVDNDCDGATDDADPDTNGKADWFRDTDADGYGDPVFREEACAAPEGYVAEGDDCDDTDAALAPGVPELCDGIDQDCDGRVDDGVMETFYVDLDGDGFGDVSRATLDACAAPSGFSADFTDCDDLRADVSPDAPELCDDADNDCDGTVDESSALDAATWYADADDDGFGDPENTVRACDPPTGFLATAGDCDDVRARVNPAAHETCATGTDDDCDGSTNDPDADGCRLFYGDADVDGFGGASSQCQCTPDLSFPARTGGDCDDTLPLVNPDAVEICGTPTDDDCDGDRNDIDAGDCTYFFVDVDADGYGDDASSDDALCLCTAEGYNSATLEGDCDDASATVNPAGIEYCDDIDEDCDGEVDDDAVDADTWYADADVDGRGSSATSLRACDVPGGFTSSSDDCDDTRATVKPGATETCFDVYDNDCDGSANDPGATGCTTWYADADGDSYGSTLSQCLCDFEGIYTSRSRTDCDDTTTARSPGNTELCSTTTVDDDCDGTVNEDGASDCTNYYNDADGDGYGTGSPTCSCAPRGTITATRIGDCDDADRLRNPGLANCGYGEPIDWYNDAISVIPDQGFTPSVATGDFNGDGLGDLAFGYEGFDTTYTDAGRVWVFYGPFPAAMDLDASSSADLVLAASGTYSLALGGSLAMGDFDGDGVDELITRGVTDTSTTARTTTAILYDYSSTGTGVLDYATTGTVLGTGYKDGRNVWDVNNDGADDYVVGSTLYWGGTAGSNPFRASGVTVSGCCAQTEDVDINGDGFSDMVTGSGVYFGSTLGAGTAGRPDLAMSLSLGLPDWNADGYGDVVVANGYYDGPSVFDPYTGVTTTPDDWGKVEVYQGSAAGTVSLAYTLLGADDWGGLGLQVFSAGDHDGDARTDLWVMRAAVGLGLLYDSEITRSWPGATEGTLWFGGGAGTTSVARSGVQATLPIYSVYGQANYSDQGWNILPLGDTEPDGFEDTLTVRTVSRTGYSEVNARPMSVLPGQPR